MESFKESSQKIRLKTLEITYNAGLSHIGTSLSCVEILNCIYSNVDCQKIINGSKDRDRIILSKGHGVAALYATLNYYHIMSDEILNDLCKDGSIWGGHPAIGTALVEHPTGALGHGASVGVGMAYVLKTLQQSQKSKVYVILGDGELNEGSNWEAFMQAVTLKLDNICFVIDRNGYCGIDSTDCCKMDNLQDKLDAFGMETVTMVGHDEEPLHKLFSTAQENGKPLAVVCNTIKGKGVSFMENNNVWHYRPLDAPTFELSRKEIIG